MVSDHERSTNGHGRLIVPADLAVLWVDGIDTLLGHRVERAVHECLEREPRRVDGDAPEHGTVLFIQGIGAVIHDPIPHLWNSVVSERHSDSPGIGRCAPEQRPIPGIERARIPAIARGTDVDDAIGYPRSAECHLWRRVTLAVTSIPFLDQLLGELHLLTPAHRAIAGIDGVQTVGGSGVERGVLSHLSNAIVSIDPKLAPANHDVVLLHRSTRGHDRNSRHILTAMQSHLIL